MSEFTPEARKGYARAYVLLDVQEARARIQSALELLAKADYADDLALETHLRDAADLLEEVLQVTDPT